MDTFNRRFGRRFVLNYSTAHLAWSPYHRWYHEESWSLSDGCRFGREYKIPPGTRFNAVQQSMVVALDENYTRQQLQQELLNFGVPHANFNKRTLCRLIAWLLTH